MASDYVDPLNLGTEEVISVDGLVDVVSKVAKKNLINDTTSANLKVYGNRNI